MVTRKKTAQKKVGAKLRLKKETIRDLDAKTKADKVRGGQKRKILGAGNTYTC